MREHDWWHGGNSTEKNDFSSVGRPVAPTECKPDGFRFLSSTLFTFASSWPKNFHQLGLSLPFISLPVLFIDRSIFISNFYRDRRISSYSDSMILFSNLFDFEIVNCLKVGPRINYINVKKLLRLKYNVFFLSFLQLIYYKDLF